MCVLEKTLMTYCWLYFQASDYPIVLSLENHCSPEQQETMAAHMLDILGDLLITSTINDVMPKCLPSPEVK